MDEQVNVKIGLDTSELKADIFKGFFDGLTKEVKQLKQENEALKNQMREIASESRKVADSAKGASDGFRNLASSIKAAVGAYIGFETIKGIARLGDEAVLTAARLQNVTGSLKEAKAAQDGLFEIAQRLQAPYQELVGSFTKILPSVKELGGGTKEATALAEILVTTAKLSGASSAEASASAQQFAQALGSGVLQGDELKSILENNQTFARTLAEALGVSVGELKGLGEQGKLTSDVVANALLGSYEKIKSQSDALPVTIGGSFTKIENSISKFIEVANNAANGPFGAIAKGIESISVAIDGFTNSVATGGDGLDTFTSVIDQLTPLIDSVKTAFDEISTAVSDNFSSSFSTLAEVVIPAVANAFELMGSAVAVAIDIAGSVISAFATAFSGIADGIMSILSALGLDFKNWGEASGAAVDGLKVVLENFGKGFSVIVEAIGLGLGTIGRLFGTVMGSIVELANGAIQAITKAFAGDFQGAVAAFSGSLQNMRNIAAKQFDGMVQDAINTSQKINQAIASSAGAAVAGGVTMTVEQSRAALRKLENEAYGPVKQNFSSLSGGGKRGGGGGGGGGAKSTGDDGLVKSQLALAQAQSNAELAIYKEQLKSEENELKRSLDAKKISQADYYAAIGDLRIKEIEAEMRAKEQERAALQTQLEEATKRGAKQSEINNIKAKTIQLDTQIAALEVKKGEAIKQSVADVEKANDAYDKQLNTFKGQLAALTGVGQLQAKMVEIAQKFNDLAPDLKNNPITEQLKRAEEGAARLADIDRKNTQEKELAEARINSLVEQGLITQGTGKNRLLQVERDLLATKLEALEAEKQIAQQAGDTGRVESLEREIELTRLRNETIKEGAEQQKQFAQDFQSSLQSNIEGLLNGTKSLKDAVLGIGKDIVASINKMIAKKISESITDTIMGSGKQGGGLFGNLFGNLFGGGQQQGTDVLAQSASIAATSLTNMAQNGVETATASLGENVLKQGLQASTTQQATVGLQTFAQALQAATSAAQSFASAGGGGGALGGLGGGGGGFDLFGSFGGGGGGLFSTLGDVFGGFFAEGGYQFADKPYIVGERGPELFVPSTAGTVIPNNAMGGGSTVVNMNIKTPDASSFRRSQQQVMTDYQRSLMRSNRRNG